MEIRKGEGKNVGNGKGKKWENESRKEERGKLVME